MKAGVTQRQIRKVVQLIEGSGMRAFIKVGAERTIIGAVGSQERELNPDSLNALDGVESVTPILSKYKLAAREFHPQGSQIRIGDAVFGGKEIPLIAGPCSVETEKQFLKTAEEVKRAGAKVLKASLFKPRTSPYEFQGLGREGIQLLKKASRLTGLPVETEVMDVRDVLPISRQVDAIRIGARNMQNYDLLRECGKAKVPVILKRGLSATVEEFLMAAEYILAHGNPNVILCERGIRTFETSTRFSLDVGAIPVLKQLTHLPVIVDPSHAAGKSSLVGPLAKAAIAAGADGLMVEVHPHPEKAWSDPLQQLTPEEFKSLVHQLKSVAHAVGRSI